VAGAESAGPFRSDRESVKLFTEIARYECYNPFRSRRPIGRSAILEGGASMGTMLVIVGVLLAAILLLVYIWPNQPEEKDPVKK
jgi:hypothetical protein